MIEKIEFCTSLVTLCKSDRYTSSNFLRESKKFEFVKGTNIIKCDIDSGEWGASYLFSMYNRRMIKRDPSNNDLFATVDGINMPLNELKEFCCYIDSSEYPLFNSKRKTVRKLIEAGLKSGKTNKTINEISEIFLLSEDRLDRPICYTGNERFRSMSAVGYAFGKQIFCFPWLSNMMFEYYSNSITCAMNALSTLGLMSILPVGR